MTGFTKRLLKMLGRLVVFVAPQLFEKAAAKKHPSMTVTQTRETLTNIKTTKRTKGDTL